MSRDDASLVARVNRTEVLPILRGELRPDRYPGCLLEPWRTEMTLPAVTPATALWTTIDADRSFGVEFEEMVFRRSAAARSGTRHVERAARRLWCDRAVEDALIGVRRRFADDFDPRAVATAFGWRAFCNSRRDCRQPTIVRHAGLAPPGRVLAFHFVVRYGGLDESETFCRSLSWITSSITRPSQALQSVRSMRTWIQRLRSVARSNTSRGDLEVFLAVHAST